MKPKSMIVPLEDQRVDSIRSDYVDREIDAPFVRSAYNYDPKRLSDATGLDCSVDGPGRTKQSFAEEADINTLIKRFGIDGKLPTGVRMPTYGDFTGVVDYQTALNAIQDAEHSFSRMPAHVRTRFANDPGAFVDFCLDDANRDEAVKLGLLPPPVVQDSPGVDLSGAKGVDDGGKTP